MKTLHLTTDEARSLLTGKTTVYRPVADIPCGGFIQALRDGAWMWALDSRFEVCATRVTCPWGDPLSNILLTEPWNRHGGLLSYQADGDWIADYEKADPAAYASHRNLAPRWEPAEKMQPDDIREPSGRKLVDVGIVPSAEGWRWVLVIDGPEEASR